ncbi:sec-independent protein translocase protein TatC [Sinobacterium caligoides]|uniref:Sec-independent protein translocase protein TatC n=1 Tax=Sinobacterium caligoides TaxID=933926 RepID=A0A3N2DEU3_9GAMM|nr:twin-arginine translocase subunit TatC [Sinobacterium caligoides]ROR97944.1 sec-independent protein translocase protein TatC [Sinobacterium caligoides]
MSTNVNDEAQPLIAHLLELRNRLLYSVLAVLIVFAGLFSYANEIYSFVSEPLRALMPEGTTMIATDVASPFLTPFKLTGVVSVFLAIPFLLYQAWSFIAPGMYRQEKRIAIPLLVSSVVLFYAGIAFAYFIVFPLIFAFFAGIAPEGVSIMTDINSYLNFILKLFFAFGVAFEIPIATILLILTGVTTSDKLAEKRPYVIVGCFVIGMLLTPPDLISQSLLAIPVWMLFELGVLAGRFIKPKTDPEQDADDSDDSDDTDNNDHNTGAA